LEIRQNIQLKQTQRLVMTPQLQQAIKMLQLSNIELSEKIDEELNNNPALEIEDGEYSIRIDKNEEIITQEILDKTKGDSKFDDFLENYSDESYLYPKITGTNRDDKKREFIEGTISREETLKEYLLEQLNMIEISHDNLMLAELIIGYVDSMGYLFVSLEDISKEINVALDKLEDALKIVQSLDPPGVGARNISECLLIQLKNKGNYPIAEKIVNDHLNEIKLKRFDQIAKKLKISIARVKNAFLIISKLEPYPGRNFLSEGIKYIIPDVTIEKRNGGFEVISNNSYVPRLRVSSYYKNLLLKKINDKKIKDFVMDKVQNARSFIHSIEQRESTLIRVTKAIFEEQKEFLEKGPRYLKPMILKNISVKLDLHESTVSRITSSKYVQTPHGIFQLKYFFSNSIPASGNREYSSISVKEMIKDIIQKEGSKRRLSDQKIVNLLGERGIKIARRTIAKYRKELSILPSNLRR